MKIRLGFVSNSSSASFVIDKKHLSLLQVMLIKQHGDVAEGDAWDIHESDEEISGDCVMDNFDMMGYLQETCGINRTHIRYDHS